jgi:hypothetical protein
MQGKSGSDRATSNGPHGPTGTSRRSWRDVPAFLRAGLVLDEIVGAASSTPCSAIVVLVTTTGAASTVRLGLRVLCTVVVLALGTVCTMLWVTSSIVAPSHMSSMSSMSHVPDVDKVADETAWPAAALGVAAFSDGLSRVCDMSCTAQVTDICTGVAGLSVSSLLALVLARRRDTFLGLLARHHTALARRPHQFLTPWTVLSLSRLSVLRV